jgi:nondiscriminating glutamyl-tRNA synthetase
VTNDHEVRVRFSSISTGSLRVGDARTAVLNWLHARKEGGKLIVRIRDVDLPPSGPYDETAVLEGLRWIGIDWDEGPDVGGPLGPYRQSERLDLYEKYAKGLMEKGLVYPCYCTEEELKAERRQMFVKGVPPRYSGKCRELLNGKRRRLEAEGRKPAMRFRVGRGSIQVNDLIHGSVTFDTSSTGDFIIMRSTGLPAYSFGVVVDDALMEVSLVIRGEDDLPNIPREILLYKALGSNPPQFAHHGLLLGPDRTQLDNQHGNTALEQFRARGYVPEALVNYLAWVGSGLGGTTEVLSRDEIIRAFDVKKAGRKAAAFDEAKLLWMNAAHVRRLAPEAVLDYWYDMGVGRMLRDRERLMEVIPVVIKNVETLDQLESLVEIFTEKSVAFSMEAEQVLRADHAGKVLSALASTLEAVDAPRSKEAYRDLMKKVEAASGCKGARLFMPVRAGLTGETAGPELEEVFCHLNRETLAHRTDRALNYTPAQD